MLRAATASIFALLLFLAVESAFAQAADVGAVVISSEFSCRVGVTDPGVDPTIIPALSVQLHQSNADGFAPICVDMQGAFDVRIGFTIPYVPAAPLPLMRAYAFGGAGCTGIRSDVSENACIVTHVLRPPSLLP